MRFEVGCVDHDPVGAGAFTGQFGEYPPEHGASAPADEAIIEGLMRAIRLRRILPPQAVADNVDDAADHPPVIDPRPAVRAGKMWADPSHLSLAQQKQFAHGG